MIRGDCCVKLVSNAEHIQSCIAAPLHAATKLPQQVKVPSSLGIAGSLQDDY